MDPTLWQMMERGLDRNQDSKFPFWLMIYLPLKSHFISETDNGIKFEFFNVKILLLAVSN